MPRHFLAALAALPLVACGLEGTDRFDEEVEASVSSDLEAELGYAPMGEDNHADTMASDDSAYLAQDDDPLARTSAAASDEAESAMPDGALQAGSDPTAITDPDERPIMQAQVVLDRQGFGPGVIDGKMGKSTRNALKGFQEANELDVTGELDDPTKQALAEWERIPATRVVTIPESWADAGFAKVPDDPAEQADMERLGYETLDEKLAERFHTTVAVLKSLNPEGRPAGMEKPAAAASPSTSPSFSPSPKASNTADREMTDNASESYFTAGQQIRVPNIGADRIAPDAIQDKGWRQTLASLGVGSEQPEVTKLVVDESEGWLKGYDGDGNLVAMFTVTTGSENDPLPVGEWGINGVGRNPPFSYNPELFWDVPDDEEKQQLPPGPNGPVGVVWIDLTKEHYGIHGTPAPETIGRAQSHGCVRLTNWDAARLSGMVSSATQVIFQA